MSALCHIPHSIASQLEPLIGDIDWAVYEVATLSIIDDFAAGCRDHEWGVVEAEDMALFLSSLGCDKIGRLV